jgi:hypothetical protein
LLDSKILHLGNKEGHPKKKVGYTAIYEIIEIANRVSKPRAVSRFAAGYSLPVLHRKNSGDRESQQDPGADALKPHG